MKTKNNVQKTILRSVAVIVSFVLISITVSAQDFWKKLLENSSFNQIALAMMETSKETAELPLETTTIDFNSVLLENEFEPELEMENWMNNENLFGVFSFEMENEIESDLTLQGWMLDENLFQVEQNMEMPLEMEAWMTSEKAWEI